MSVVVNIMVSSDIVFLIQPFRGSGQHYEFGMHVQAPFLGRMSVPIPLIKAINTDLGSHVSYIGYDSDLKGALHAIVKIMVSYYKGLMVEMQRGKADSLMDDSMALTDVPPQLALADGDDQTVGNDDAVAKKRGFRIEYQDTFWFGRFHFQHQVYEFETHEQHRWRVDCPYHKDGDNVPCARSKKFDPENQEPVLRQLRQWCLAGRGCTSRAKPKHCSHKAITFSDLQLASKSAQQRALARGEADSSWIVVAAAPAGATDGASSSSSESSSNSGASSTSNS